MSRAQRSHDSSRVVREDQGNSRIGKAGQANIRVVKAAQGNTRIAKADQDSRRAIKTDQGSSRIVKGGQGSRRLVKGDKFFASPSVLAVVSLCSVMSVSRAVNRQTVYRRIQFLFLFFFFEFFFFFKKTFHLRDRGQRRRGGAYAHLRAPGNRLLIQPAA